MYTRGVTMHRCIDASMHRDTWAGDMRIVSRPKKRDTQSGASRYYVGTICIVIQVLIYSRTPRLQPPSLTTCRPPPFYAHISFNGWYGYCVPRGLSLKTIPQTRPMTSAVADAFSIQNWVNDHSMYYVHCMNARFTMDCTFHWLQHC